MPSMPRPAPLTLAAAIWLGPVASAHAGMPSIMLTDIARLRLQSISFFLACALVCAWIVRRIWNGLRADFPRLPYLSFGKATGLITLWGLLFLLVLTMISGSRELLTPGAWTKSGATFKLATPPDPAREARRQHLDRLRIALWTYARGHDRCFPPNLDAPEIPEEAWQMPDPSGMRYIYRGGLSLDAGATPLAFEPGIFGPERFVLRADGVILAMTPEELEPALKVGGMR